MVKLIILVKKKTDMDLDEFHTYWRNNHGGLYKTMPALKKYVRKYNQCHTLPEAYKRNAAPYDGVAELWFDSYDAIDQFLEDPDYMAKVRPDEKKFCDFESLVFFATSEEPMIEG